MSSILVENIVKEVPPHSVNADIIDSHDFAKLVRGVLRNGGITMFLFGSSRSGKTTFLSNIITPLFAESSIVAAFLPNSVADVYDCMRENKNVVIIPELRTEVIADVVQFQRKQKSLPDYKTVEDPPRWTFILDDVTSDLFKNNNEVARGFTTYRNLGISTIVAAQYITMAKKESRANVNLSIFFRLNTPEARMSAIKDHLPDLFSIQGSSIADKADAYNALTRDYIIISDNLNGLYHLLPRD